MKANYYIAPPRNKEKQERYQSLNGLRAIAAIGIVAMHVQANLSIKPDLGYLSYPIISSLGIFVLLFMIISAFSMCCGYYDRIKNNLISPKAFYGRRVKRILPFFALMTVLDILLERNSSSICEGFSNLTLFFNFFQKEIKVIGVGWFIGVICVFYMIFPCFVALMDNKKRAIVVTIVSIILTAIAVEYFEINYRENFSLYFPFFTIGGLIYLYRKDIIRIVSKMYYLVLLTCIVITCLYFIIDISDGFAVRIMQLLMFSMWVCFGIAKPNKFLSNKSMDFVSGVSMEVYLCHMMFFRIVQKCKLDSVFLNSSLNYIFVFFLTILGAIVFSYIVKYKIINKIILKFS